MLVCTRIGAVHSIVFGGFSPDSLKDRIVDAECIVVDHRRRRSARGQVPMKACRQGIASTPSVQKWWWSVRTGGDFLGRLAGRDVVSRRDRQHRRLPPGADGRRRPAAHPVHLRLDRQAKGVLHTTGGYPLHAAYTHKLVFDYHDGRHLLVHRRRGLGHRQLHRLRSPGQRRTTMMFEGVPTYPRMPGVSGRSSTSTRSIFYTAPTAIRFADARGRSGPVKDDLARRCVLLGTVGEPINPKPGSGTIASSATPLPDRRHLVADRNRRHPDHRRCRAPSPEAGLRDAPFFGVTPALVDAEGRNSWKANRRQPGASPILAGADAHRLWRSPAFIETYFSMYPGMYFTGDGCRRDEDNLLLDHRPRR